MVSSDVRPYLTTSEEVIVWEPWHIRDGDDWSPLPDFADGWDPATDLVIRRIVRVDVAELEAQTQVDFKHFAVSISWRTSTTGMVDSAPIVPLSDSGVMEIVANLVGARIGGTLQLRSTVVLTDPPKHKQVGVVQLPGSTIAEDLQELVLERGAPMFPISVIDFARTRYSPTASWHLETGSDLDAPFLGSFMLVINSRDTELCSAIARATRDRASQALCNELESGVASLMIELAVHERDHLLESTWPAGSVGDVLKRMLERSELVDAVAPSAYDLTSFRTRLAGAVRAMGEGRVFR